MESGTSTLAQSAVELSQTSEDNVSFTRLLMVRYLCLFIVVSLPKFLYCSLYSQCIFYLNNAGATQ